jgi:hypothetical protein
MVEGGMKANPSNAVLCVQFRTRLRERTCCGRCTSAYFERRPFRAVSSQGGVKVPTGGKGILARILIAKPVPTFAEYAYLKPASAFFIPKKGQQIRCDSEADG